MTCQGEQWREERWRDELGDAFAGLVPECIDDRPLTGSIEGITVGELGAFEVAGSPQTVRRSRSAVRRRPTDAVKVCVQLRGRAIVRQGDRELVIRPGQLGIYDTRRAYDLRLEGDWRCAVMAFPPSALRLPHRLIDATMQRAHDAGSGPGAVLDSFVRAITSTSTMQVRTRGSWPSSPTSGNTSWTPTCVTIPLLRHSPCHRVVSTGCSTTKS